MINRTNIKEFANYLDNSILNREHMDCCKVVYVNVTFLIDDDKIVNHLKTVIPAWSNDFLLNDVDIKLLAFQKYIEMVESKEFYDLYETRIRIEKSMKEMDKVKRLQAQN